MEQDLSMQNTSSNGEQTKRKSFLEKLGLVEPVAEDVLEPSVLDTFKSKLDDSLSRENDLDSDIPILKPTFSQEKMDAPVIGYDDVPDMPESVIPAPEKPSYTPPTFSSPISDSERKEKLYETSFNHDYTSAVAAQKEIDMLTISEIYSLYNLKPLTARDTVYLIENFLKALPTNLPTEVKKEAMMKLLAASYYDIDSLAIDGNTRIATMDKYLDSFTKDLEDVIAHNQEQIKDLTEKIAEHTKVISEKMFLLDEQKSLIKFETHRIISILDSAGKGPR